MTTEYTTLAGRVITLPVGVGAAGSDLIERLSRGVTDPAVTTNDMIALVYGPDNPVLDHATFPGRAAVTPAVLTNPLYKVMADLIDRKRVAMGELDIAAAHARHTVSVPEAATQLGITEQAVRAAIDADRLAAIYRNGQWWLTPESLASYQVSRRGPKGKGRGGEPAPGAAPVLVRVGSAPGASLSVRVRDGDLITERKDGGAVLGRFPPGWRSAVVRTTLGSGGARAFTLEPAEGEQNEIGLGGLYVRGPFRIAKKYNTAKAATEAWESFGRATGETTQPTVVPHVEIG